MGNIPQKTVFQGDTVHLDFDLQEPDGSPLDITNAVVSWALTPYDDLETNLITKETDSGITHTTPLAGRARVTITAGELDDPGTYYHELDATLATGETYTYGQGLLIVKPAALPSPHPPSGAETAPTYLTTANYTDYLRFLDYKGAWNASTNTPTLTSGSGTKGWYYSVSVAGSTSIDGESTWAVGDFISYNGTVWQKTDNDSADDAFIPDGTGAVSRTIDGMLRERVSVLNFIPTEHHAAIRAGSSTTDLATYIQAAIDYLETITVYAFDGYGRPSLLFPSGGYFTSSLTADKAIGFIGEGRQSTTIFLKSGNTDPLFTCNAENISGTSADDTNHFLFSGLTLVGNRVDSTTTGVSHGLSFPTPAWSIGTQYSPSAIISDVEISNFTGNAINLAANRNLALLTNVIARYCNDSAFVSSSYDHRLVDCDFGVCKNYGIRLIAGGAVSAVGVNIYSNTNAVVINSSVNSPNYFTNCAFDFSTQDGFVVASATTPTTIVASRFLGNSTSSAGTYDDIKIAGSSAVLKVTSCDFVHNTQQVRYLLSTTTSPKVFWINNTYSTGTAPYATAITNDFTLLITAGGTDAYIGPNAGVNTLSGMVGSSEVWKQTSSNFITNVELLGSVAGNPARFINTSNSASVQAGKFEGDRSAPAANDIAYVSGYLSDSAGTQIEVARMSWQASSVTAGAVSGLVLLGSATSSAIVNRLFYNATAFGPLTNDGMALGTASLSFSDLFLASGAVINFNNGNAILTHSAGNLTSNVPLTANGFIPSSSTVPTNGLYLPASNTLGWAVNSAPEMQLTASALSPAVSDGNALGTSSLMWSDLFLATGGVINWANGGITITEASDVLQFAGATSYKFDASALPTTSDGAALGSASLMWSDLFLASGSVVNFDNGDVTLTHSANTLAFAGASSGYTFDAKPIITVASAAEGIRIVPSGAPTKFFVIKPEDGTSVCTFGYWGGGSWAAITTPGDIYTFGNLGMGAISSSSTWALIAAGTTAKSQMRLTASTAPTSPVNGDVWFDGTDIKIRVAGATKTFTIV